jgi:3',5'-cyclic AMP phosphodiesterase CpdA
MKPLHSWLAFVVPTLLLLPFRGDAQPAGLPLPTQQPQAARPGMPVPAQTVPRGGYFFIQLSDTQFGFSNDDKDFIQDTANAELVVTTVNRLKPAFVIITGDLVNKAGDAGQIAEYQRIVARINKSVPVYSVAGNHDLGNEPTAASLAAYRKIFGKDYYSFRHGPLYGIVLNSTLIHTPANVPEEYARQNAWLRAELATARASDARHVVIFEHHPAFLEKASEPDQYFNLPLARREPLLKLLRESGVHLLVSGHLHRPNEASDGGLQSVVTGAVGRPLGGSSGLRVFVVTDEAITHRFYSLGELPYRVTTQ